MYFKCTIQMTDESDLWEVTRVFDFDSQPTDEQVQYMQRELENDLRAENEEALYHLEYEDDLRLFDWTMVEIEEWEVDAEGWDVY